MAVVKVPITAISFNGDPLTTATLVFFILWLLVTLVQWGQAARIVSSALNAPRRDIFGLVLGSTVCLSISYGFRIGRIIIQNSDSDLADNDVVFVAFYAIDLFPHIIGVVLLYISIFLIIYRRVIIYVGPSSQMWFIKKIVDGVFIGIWALMFIVEISWIVAGFVGLYIDQTMSIVDYNKRSSITRSLDIANSSFFIIVHVAAIAAIIMLNSARNSQKTQDPVVGTLMHAMLPVMVLRAIWNIISTALYDTPGVIKTADQSESVNLADAILEQLFSAVMIGIMIRLGFQTAFWDIPAGFTPQPGSVPQQPHGAQGMVGGQQGMTMLLGPNGLPMMGPNGQPMFVPVAPAPGQGPGAASMEAWKYQSMYSPTPASTTHNLPPYQQQNVLPYGQFVPQPQFVAPQQQQFAHLPQPPAGYFYQPPGANMQPVGPSLQMFQPQPQQQQPLPPLPAGAQSDPNQSQHSLSPSDQPNVNRPPQTQSSLNPSANGPPTAAPS